MQELRNEVIRFLKKHTAGNYQGDCNMYVFEMPNLKIVYDGEWDDAFVIVGEYEDTKVRLDNKEKITRALHILLFYDYFMEGYYEAV